MWYFQIKNIIKKEKPDVINAHTPVPFISDVTARVCGDIPFILTYNTGAMMLKGKLLEDLLSDEEIIKINRDFEIEAHTMTYPRLIKISEMRNF